MARTISLDEIESVRTIGPDEVESVSPVESPQLSEYAPETSMLEAGLRGAAQGLTFDSADELTARLESFLTNKPYEQALQESRSEYKLSEEEYPVTSLAGQVAGGVAQGVGLTALTGGAAAPAAGAGALSRLAKLGQVAKGVLVPTKQASALKNIGSAAVTGAAMGGLTSIGASEKEGLEALSEAPSGMLGGAITGGVLGAAVEGLGKAGEAAGKYISKGIDEGKYPEFFKMVRSGARLGEKDKDFLSQASSDRAEKDLYKATEEVLIPKLKQSLDTSRTLRNHILTNADKKISIEDEVKGLAENLSQRSETGVKDMLGNIFGNVERIAGPLQKPKNAPILYDATGNIIKVSSDVMESPLKDLDIMKAFNIMQEIEGTIKDELPAEVKKEAFAAISKIKNKIRSSVSEKEVESILKKNTNNDLVGLYKSNIQNIKGTIKDKNPIGILDEQMSSVLNASEILGDLNPSGKNEAQKIKDVETLFNTIISQPKNTSGGFLKKERFDKAMNRMENSFPEVASEFKKSISPIVEELEYRKYIRGEGWDQGRKDTGLIRKGLGDVGALTAEAVNIAAATKSAAAKGKAGPVPLLPVGTALRPVVATLTRAKTAVDKMAQKNPNSATYKMFSDMLNNALELKAESRRAAVLNTLMQYESFRNIVEQEEN